MINSALTRLSTTEAAYPTGGALVRNGSNVAVAAFGLKRISAEERPCATCAKCYA
jgi:hypothetical protein